MNKKIIITVLVAILAISIIIYIVSITKKEKDGNSVIEQAKSNNNVIKEQTKEDDKMEKELIVDNIVIEGKTYNFGEITLSDLEKNGFHIDYDNAELYIDETNNKMYRGYDGQHPELLITEERKDVKYIMQPGDYNQLKYKIVNDSYSGMKFQGDMFDEQYCPMELGIQNWSSNEEKNYKDCDVTSISFGTTSKEAWNNEKEILNRLRNYPSIKINGIELLSDESDVLKTFGEASSTNDFYLKTINYDNDYQLITFTIYNGKVCNIKISLTMKFYK